MIITSLGGSGSTLLISKLKQLYKTDDRIDGNLHEIDLHKDVDFNNPKLQNRVRVTTSDLKAIEHGFINDINIKSSLYKFDVNDIDLEKQFIDYIDYINNNSHVSFFTRLHDFNFFSENKIRNTIFLIRNPLDTYLSYSKPERHGNGLISALGGKDSIDAITYFTTAWNNIIEEYEKCIKLNLEPRLVRYEHMLDDFRFNEKVYNKLKNVYKIKSNYNKPNIYNIFNEKIKQNKYYDT